MKHSTGIDIEENVKVLLPMSFNHIPDNNCFLSGKIFKKSIVIQKEQFLELV